MSVSMDINNSSFQKNSIYLSIPHCLPNVISPNLMAVFICLNSGVWCATRHGKSTSQSFLCWWDPSLDTWCLVSWPTGKIPASCFPLYYCPMSKPLFFSMKVPVVRKVPLPLLHRFGRHPVLIISVLFMLVFGLTVAFSVNVPMFSTLRFFEGFCLAGITLSLYVLSKFVSFVQKVSAYSSARLVET